MKIEKVNDNQIRCTLTREDLASRELKISELAYGTEKAKSLFRDMMQQANFEFGFEAEDIPLMIEAIPLNAECIVLIITKVEDPEELDTRFSRFAPSVTEDLDSEGSESDESPEEVAELFQKLQEKDRAGAAPASHTSRTIGVPETDVTRTRLFQFDSLRQVWDAAAVTGAGYRGLSTLYKAERTGKYLLILTQNGCDKEHFDRICSILSEYGSMKRTPASGHVFLQEHCQPLIAENALLTLSNM